MVVKISYSKWSGAMTWWCKDFPCALISHNMPCDSDSIYELNECWKLYSKKRKKIQGKESNCLPVYCTISIPRTAHTHTRLRWYRRKIWNGNSLLLHRSSISYVSPFSTFTSILLRNMCVCVCLCVWCMFLCVIVTAALTITILPNLCPNKRLCLHIHVYLSMSRSRRFSVCIVLRFTETNARVYPMWVCAHTFWVFFNAPAAVPDIW